MFLLTIALCVVTARAEFDGLGEYLCGYYDGDNDICPAPNAPQDDGPICMTVCRSCDDDYIKDYVNNLITGNPNPPTGERANVTGPLSYGDTAPLQVYSKCDTSKGHTVVLRERLLYPGQLNFIEFYVSGTCHLRKHKGLVVGIFREQNRAKNGPCSYNLVSMVTISKATVDSLLGGRRVGLVHYTFGPEERVKMEFLAGDHVGFMVPGCGLISYDLTSEETVCMDNVGTWAEGSTYNVSTPEVRAKRKYAVRLGYMPW